MANLKGAKKKSREFWEAAVARLNGGENALALVQGLGVNVRGLYRWRDRLEARGDDAQRAREAALAQEVQRLKRALAEKVLEVEFLQGALHKVEARRRAEGSSGAKASTTRSGK